MSPALRRAGQAAVCGIGVGSRKGSAKRRLTGPSRVALDAVLLWVVPFAGAFEGGVAAWRFLRDTGRQAVAEVDPKIRPRSGRNKL